MNEITKTEFAERYIKRDLQRWLSDTPRTPESFILSVEEWAAQRLTELRRLEELEAR